MNSKDEVRIVEASDLTADHQKQISDSLEALRKQYGGRAVAVAMTYHNLSGAIYALEHAPINDQSARKKAAELAKDAIAGTMTFISLMSGTDANKTLEIHSRIMSSMRAIESDFLTEAGDTPAVALAAEALAKARATS